VNHLMNANMAMLFLFVSNITIHKKILCMNNMNNMTVKLFYHFG